MVIQSWFTYRPQNLKFITISSPTNTAQPQSYKASFHHSNIDLENRLLPVEFWGWTGNFTPHFTVHVISYSCMDLSLFMSVKGATDGFKPDYSHTQKSVLIPPLPVMSKVSSHMNQCSIQLVGLPGFSELRKGKWGKLLCQVTYIFHTRQNVEWRQNLSHAFCSKNAQLGLRVVSIKIKLEVG